MDTEIETYDKRYFPGKLRFMLDNVDELGLSHGSSWVSEGRAFAVHSPDVFMKEVAPLFFDKQTRIRSFYRQLSIWGFSRLETDAGGRAIWFHKDFARDKPEMMNNMKRVPVKRPRYFSSNEKKPPPPDSTVHQMSKSPDCQDSTAKPNATSPFVKAAQTSSRAVHMPHPCGPKAAHDVGLHDPKNLPSSSERRMAVPIIPPRPFFSASNNAAFSLSPSDMYSAAYDQFHSPFQLADYPPLTASPYLTHPQLFPSGSNFNGLYPNDTGEVAMQLLACRNAAPSRKSITERSDDINRSIYIRLALMMESRDRSTSYAKQSLGLPGQDLTATIAQRDLFQRGRKP